MDIAIVRDNGEDMKILVNNEQQNDNYNDITVLVYDECLDAIADVAAINRDGVLMH